MTANAPFHRTALRSFALGFVATCALAGGIALHAQAIAGHDSNAPVNTAADRIELQDRQDRVVLSGNVVITQGDLTLRAARTIVNYADTGQLQIQRITATGGVSVDRGSEHAEGNTAIYDFNRRIITMAGDVHLNRNGDTLNGGRATIDLRSGLSSLDGSARGTSPVKGEPPVKDSSGGRVTGTFSVPQN